MEVFDSLSVDMFLIFIKQKGLIPQEEGGRVAHARFRERERGWEKKNEKNVKNSKCFAVLALSENCLIRSWKG